MTRLAVLFGFLAAAAASASPPASLGLGGNRLQQVAITTRDLPRAVRFYRDTLGLRFLFETNGMAFFDMAGTRLMIARDASRGAGRPPAILYIDAPDFAATVARMNLLGLPLDGGVETVRRGAEGELRLQQFHDPDGNALAVMGLVQPPSISR